MEELAEQIVLVDIIEDMPMGKALDLWESAPINSFDARTVGANDYGKSADSDIIVITSGLPRKPGMSRDDLREKNVEIARIVTEGVVKESPNAIIIMVANPLDVMTWVSWKVSGFPKNRVMGMAGILDSARFRSFIAEKLDVSAEDVQAMLRTVGFKKPSAAELPDAASRWSSGWTQIVARV